MTAPRIKARPRLLRWHLRVRAVRQLAGPVLRAVRTFVTAWRVLVNPDRWRCLTIRFELRVDDRASAPITDADEQLRAFIARRDAERVAVARRRRLVGPWAH